MVDPIIPRLVLVTIGLASLAGLARKWIVRWRGGEPPSTPRERRELAALIAFGLGIALIGVGLLLAWLELPPIWGIGGVVLGVATLVVALVLRAMSL